MWTITYGVTRGQLPQRAGSLCLNGGGAAAAVAQMTIEIVLTLQMTFNSTTGSF